MKISRREFVGSGLAAAAAATCSGCRPTFITRAGTGKRPTGPIKWVNSACLQCPAGCGIRVKTIAGNAIKIEGNPDHPINKGRLCPKGQAGLQVLYDPDRIQGPMRRAGKRGAGNWESISWEEAITDVADRLARIRRDEGPHTVAIMGGRYRGHMRELFRRFARSYGTPNQIDSGSIGSANSPLAHYLTQGVRDYLAYDWENANYVISFGASLTEAFRPTVLVQRMVAHLRRGRPGRRGKIVTVDPRLSVTASKSDEWVPIRPGTDGALALGMAAVIVREGLHDQPFLDEHTAGFDEWKKNVLEEVSLDFVSEETGVPADRIERLAREFAERSPAFAVAGRGAGMHTNGLYNLTAIHCLNALVGNIDSPGGVIVQEYPPFTAWPEIEPDEIAQRGLSVPRLDGAGTSRFPLAESVSSALAEAILGESPYKVSAVLAYYTNPLFSTPNPQKFRKALGKVPLVVSFSPFMDDTTAMADLVLPDHTYLERLQLDVPVAGAGVPALALRQPVVEPLYHTKSTGDVIIQIAKAMGDPVSTAFPWADYEEAERSTLGGVAEAASLSPEEFWQKLLDEGVWSGGPYEYGNAERTYRTPSGKFEFVSSLMRERLTAIAAAAEINVDELAAALGIEARGEKVFMPHYESPGRAAGGESFPLYLNAYKTMTHAEGRGASQPWLQESYGVQLSEFWGPWVEINFETAREHGVRDGEMIWLESAAGKIKVKARVFDGAMPGVVNMPYEYGHVAGGRWAENLGVNPNDITSSVYDRLCGAVSRSATRVRVRT
ncbi:MAG: molybdopterin-containing oxidoreductase family protein [Planctomycetota bacterium]|jgi:anaerobic selenocysteine-containing dehydrogenase